MRRLQKRKEELQNELYQLHFTDVSMEMYQQRRADIEYEIAIIEEAMEYEQKLNPMRIGLAIFTIIAIISVIALSIIA